MDTPPHKVLYVNGDGNDDEEYKHDSRQVVYQLSGGIQARQLSYHEMNVGVRVRWSIQSPPHLPVPIGAKAVPKAIPYSQNHPRKERKCYCYEMGFPCLFPYPTDDVEKGKKAVKDEEKPVQEDQQGVTHNRSL